MKITEITEGWGEYSNKSNHRMNKFKRQETDEGWGEFKSAVQRGADAAMGAADRQLRDISNTAMAKMGSGRAQGAKELQRVTGGVVKNFNRYLGQIKSKPTVGALKQYLSALGFQDVIVELSRADMLAKNQARVNAPAKKKPNAPVKPAQGFQGAGRKDTDVLTRNDLFDIIGDHVEKAVKNGTLPKELKKFLGQ